MKDARSSDQQANARSAGDESIGSSSIAAGLLVAETYEAYPKIDGFLGNVDDRNAHQSEDDRDAEVVQGVRNDFGARWRCHVASSKTRLGLPGLSYRVSIVIEIV